MVLILIIIDYGSNGKLDSLSFSISKIMIDEKVIKKVRFGVAGLEYLKNFLEIGFVVCGFFFGYVSPGGVFSGFW